MRSQSRLVWLPLRDSSPKRIGPPRGRRGGVPATPTPPQGHWRCLFGLLRHHLQGTELATAQMHTLGLKLLKIGARLRENRRRIRIHPASGYPYRNLLVLVLQNLRACPG